MNCGNSVITEGSYLDKLNSDDTGTYAVSQHAAGDNGSQSIIISGGESISAKVRASVQAYDTTRGYANSLYLQPLGGDTIANDILADGITASSGTFDGVDVDTIDASEVITCPVYDVPVSNYDPTNISNPKATLGLTTGTGYGDGEDYETMKLQINS